MGLKILDIIDFKCIDSVVSFSNKFMFMCWRIMLQLLLPLLCYSYCLILEVHVTVQHDNIILVELQYIRENIFQNFSKWFFWTFKSVVETLVCDHSNESYWAVLSCRTVYHAIQGGSYFFNLSTCSTWVILFITLCKIALPF